MGGCWSGWRSEAEIERARNSRRTENHTIFVNNVFSYRTRGGRRIPQRSNYDSQSCYGEYNCPCGRFWTSTLSWANNYQVCKRCRKHVYPRNQRAVRQTDIKRGDGKSAEHSRELCQRCKELGRYCGSSNQNQKSTYDRIYLQSLKY